MVAHEPANGLATLSDFFTPFSRRFFRRLRTRHLYEPVDNSPLVQAGVGVVMSIRSKRGTGESILSFAGPGCAKSEPGSSWLRVGQSQARRLHSDPASLKNGLERLNPRRVASDHPSISLAINFLNKSGDWRFPEMNKNDVLNALLEMKVVAVYPHDTTLPGSAMSSRRSSGAGSRPSNHHDRCPTPWGSSPLRCPQQESGRADRGGHRSRRGDGRCGDRAGADFVVSPVTDFPTIRECGRRGVLVAPGAFTPTEILNAWKEGADIVKVFPATSLGPKYFKDLKGPLPHIRLMPTGGVSLENARDFIAAGACCVGIGAALLDPRSSPRTAGTI